MDRNRNIGIYQLVSAMKPKPSLVATNMVAIAEAEPRNWFCCDNEGEKIVFIDGVYTVEKGEEVVKCYSKEEAISTLVGLLSS